MRRSAPWIDDSNFDMLLAGLTTLAPQANKVDTLNNAISAGAQLTRLTDLLQWARSIGLYSSLALWKANFDSNQNGQA